MAQLTWRDVAAPDFSPAMEGYRSFSNLLGNAFSGLKQSVGEFDRSNTEDLNKAIMLDLMKVQDPTAAKDYATSHLNGVDPTKIDASTLAAIGARPQALLEQQKGFRTSRLADAQDAAAPIARQALTLAADGKHAEAQALLAQLPKDLGLGDISSVLSGVQGAERGQVGIAGDILRNTGQELRNKSDQREYNWSGEAHDLSQKADDIAGKIAASASDIYDADAQLNKLGLDGRTYNAVKARLGMPMISDYSAIAGGGGLGAPTGSNTTPFDTVLGNGKYGQPPAPLSSMSVGDAISFGEKVLIPNSKAAGVGTDSRGTVGSSAMGAYQITKSTLEQYAPSVLGSNWRNEKMTPQNQDKIAEAIFNANKGSAAALAGQWASLTKAEAEQVRKMPWEQARQHIAAGETGAAPDALTLALGGSVTAQGRRNADLQRNAGTLGDNFLTAYKDNSVTADVAAKLAGSTFKGGSPPFIAEKIDQVISQARQAGVTINPALAGEILKESTTSSWASRNLPGWTPFVGSVGNGFQIDSGKVSQLIKSVANGDLDKTIVGNDNAALHDQQQGLAQQQYNIALQRYNQARAAASQGKPVNLAQFQSDLAKASLGLQAVQQGNANNPGVASYGHPDVPAPVQAPPAPRPIARTTPAPGNARVVSAAPASSREAAYAAYGATLRPKPAPVGRQLTPAEANQAWGAAALTRYLKQQ